jgi:hypothetical protein
VNRFDLPFQPIRGSSNSSASSFDVTLSTASQLTAFESSGARKWEGPSGRAVRFAESSGVDYRVSWGSSDIVAGATGSMLVLGGAVESFSVQPKDTHVALMTTSTGISSVNVTLGYGR